jgi:Cu/Ag efflux pump CusA
MLARYGISVGDFTEFVDVAFAGEKVGEVYEGAQSFDSGGALRSAKSGRDGKYA